MASTSENCSRTSLGVPALWLPWMAFPVMSERQSGVVFPELSLSSLNSFEIGLQFMALPPALSPRDFLDGHSRMRVLDPLLRGNCEESE